MEGDKFSLKYNDFGSVTKKTFENFLFNEEFSDVTLVCDDNKQIKAHKVILSSSSSFFRHILLNNPHNNPLLYLKGVKFEDLKAVTEFIYQGETQLKESNLESFLNVAVDLEVEGVMESHTKKDLVDNNVKYQVDLNNLSLEYMPSHENSKTKNNSQKTHNLPNKLKTTCINIGENLEHEYTEVSKFPLVNAANSTEFECEKMWKNICEQIYI